MYARIFTSCTRIGIAWPTCAQGWAVARISRSRRRRRASFGRQRNYMDGGWIALIAVPKLTVRDRIRWLCICRYWRCDVEGV